MDEASLTDSEGKKLLHLWNESMQQSPESGVPIAKKIGLVETFDGHSLNSLLDMVRWTASQLALGKGTGHTQGLVDTLQSARRLVFDALYLPQDLPDLYLQGSLTGEEKERIVAYMTRQMPVISSAIDQRITAVLTSCGRPLLLRRTLQSFFKYNKYPLYQLIVVEDGSTIQRQVADEFGDRNINWLATGERVGQIASIDYAYSHVRTPYIFHLEDDWEFYRSGFIPASLAVLQDQPKCLQVWIRGLSDTNKHPVEPYLYGSGGVSWRRMALSFRDTWHGFSFNPGLRRMRDYVAIGGYGHFAKFEFNKPLSAEKVINKMYHKRGFYAAILAEEEGFVRHIGKAEHVGAPV